MKIAVITSSIGTNELIEPVKFDDVDYHAFVDKSPANGLTTHPVLPFSADPTYKNRRNSNV